MWRIWLIYGVSLALVALALEWLQLHILVRTHPVEIYLSLFAAACMALGGWVSRRLWQRPAAGRIDPGARLRLGLSEREFEVLTLIAAGRSNKDIARSLAVSPNTIKTHVANLFQKLGARRRTEAIAKARDLGLMR